MPDALGLTAITSYLGIADIPNLAQLIGMDPSPTFGQVTFNGGKVTALALLPGPSG